jgi:hypothetical protein
MENDIPESKILDIEYYMDKHAEEIVDFIEEKITEERLKAVMPTGEIFDRIVNELTKEMPFESESEPKKTHTVLAYALVSSLWCGWRSQALVSRSMPNFKQEYLDQFQRAIMRAYVIGRKYARASLPD